MGPIARRLILFPCQGELLAGTLDAAPGTTGLLIVSGGNEVRGGAHRGMVLLAARLAADGIPTFRYDRRGIGDSSGTDHGYAGARDDLLAAAAAYRAAMPQLDRIVGFGNCDAAAALALWGRDAGLDSLLLANPWLRKERDDLPPAAAITHRYRERLLSLDGWRDLLRGNVDLRGLYRGLRKVLARTVERHDPPVAAAIAEWGGRATALLAARDATALAFAARRLPIRTHIVDTDSHGFARVADQAALYAALRRALA